MNPAGVLLVAAVAFWIGRLSLYRTLRGQALELELARLRVDDVDQLVDRKDRYRHHARRLLVKVREVAR